MTTEHKLTKAIRVGDVTFHEGVDYSTVQRAITRHIKYWKDQFEQTQLELGCLVHSLEVNARNTPNVTLSEALEEFRNAHLSAFKDYL